VFAPLCALLAASLTLSPAPSAALRDGAPVMIPPEALTPVPPPPPRGALPFLASLADGSGATLPLPVGLTVTGLFQGEDILPKQLRVGVHRDGEQVQAVDAAFVQFGTVHTQVQNVLARADAWIFPFFNLYGFVGETWSQTKSVIVRPLLLDIETDSKGVTAGFGGTLAGGWGTLFFVALDMNFAWTSLDILTQPQRTMTFTPRAGHVFKPEWTGNRDLTLWLGTTYEEFQGDVVGSASLAGNVPDNVAALLPADYGVWLNGLPSDQRAAVSTLLGQLVQATGRAEDAAHARADFTLQLKTRRSNTLLVGGELQLDPQWQVRVEAGFLGSRATVMAGLTCRMGL
jgi:hypothetical protein